MEQKDYILREIEKMGMVLRAILNKFKGNNDNTAIQIEKQFEETKEMLASDLDFDLDKFIAQNKSQSTSYLNGFKELNIENLELLAEVFIQMSTLEEKDKRKMHLTKALQILEYCKQTDKTYSFDREARINEIVKQIDE
jgi:hypothetical protein